MLKKARQRSVPLAPLNTSLVIGTAFELPVRSGFADLLINNYMVDLIAYDVMDQVLVAFRRVLKARGKLVPVNMTTGETFGSTILEARSMTKSTSFPPNSWAGAAVSG